MDAIQRFVGEIVGRLPRSSTSASTNARALLVHTYQRSVAKDPRVPLWHHGEASAYERRLFPDRQVWVDVDYTKYRWASHEFGFEIPAGNVLDHIQNRAAIRLHREICDLARLAGSELDCRAHAYIRLCPVRSVVNTNAGVNQGGEGLEKEFWVGIRGIGLFVRWLVPANERAWKRRTRLLYDEGRVDTSP